MINLRMLCQSTLVFGIALCCLAERDEAAAQSSTTTFTTGDLLCGLSDQSSWESGKLTKTSSFVSYRTIAERVRRQAQQERRRNGETARWRKLRKRQRDLVRKANSEDAQCTTAAQSSGSTDQPGTDTQLCTVTSEQGAVDTQSPTRVVGDGTAASCTGAAFVAAVAQGGIITFNCGPDPVTIKLTETAKVFNNTGPLIVIDGGGKVTLDGQNSVRILYQNTCDQNQVWTTPTCQNQDHPQLVVQNLTFINGNAKGLDPDGGGAIFVRGGRFRIVNSKFLNNVCDDTGPDVGGGAVRVLSQYNNLPVYVVNSTFGGAAGLGNVCSNGGALSSIGVSYTILNSVFTHNQAIGDGANPAQSGTPGGGSGGAIYNDGNTFNLNICGSEIQNNQANEGGGAIFFVSNDRTGTLTIDSSTLRSNPSLGFETNGYPGIFVLASGNPQITNSTIE